MKTDLAKTFLDNASFKAICQIDSSRLDELINLYFLGKANDRNGYECIAEEEWNNDSQHSFTVLKRPIDGYNLKQIEDARGGKIRGPLHPYLQLLCNEGIIPECELVISVSW